jgi:hypothetical protein
MGLATVIIRGGQRPSQGLFNGPPKNSVLEGDKNLVYGPYYNPPGVPSLSLIVAKRI